MDDDLLQAAVDVGTSGIGGKDGDTFMLIFLIPAVIVGIIATVITECSKKAEPIPPVIEKVETKPEDVSKETFSKKLGRGTKNAARDFIKGLFD